MKIAVLLLDGAKQVMLTPETEHEKQALKMIAPGDKLEAMAKWGTFRDKEHYGKSFDLCQGGYYREFANSESLMFVITTPETKEGK